MWPRIWMSRSSSTSSRPTWIRSARSGSSFTAKMPRLEPRHQTEVDGVLVGEIATLGDLDRVDLADDVSDRGVRCGELLAVALGTMDPGDRRDRHPGRDELAGEMRHRSERVVVDLRARHDGEPLVEQLHERPDHAALRLAALAEDDDVVPGDDGVLECWQHVVVVAEHAVDDRPSLADACQQIAAHLVLHGLGAVAGSLQLPERRGTRVCLRLRVRTLRWRYRCGQT